MLEVGLPAPAFTLPNSDMEDVTLADFAGARNVVLYFYIKDGSPGCTVQAVEFSDLIDRFDRLDTTILGISPDDCLQHADFRDHHGIGFDLLSDAEGDVCRAYDVLQPREVNGMIRHVVQRATFLIDKQGIIQYAQYGVVPRGHARDMLRITQGL